MYSDTDIKNSEDITIKNYEDFQEQLQPASFDCRLDKEFLRVRQNEKPVIDINQEIQYEKVVAEEVIIPPKSFLLASTKEYVELGDNIVAFVMGRSSIGRHGLFIQNAGWVDPGFKGTITLELFNANATAIRLHYNRRICQLVFQETENAADAPYIGKYIGQKGVTGSKAHEDDDI